MAFVPGKRWAPGRGLRGSHSFYGGCRCCRPFCVVDLNSVGWVFFLEPTPADEPVRLRGVSCFLGGRSSWPESIADGLTVSRGILVLLLGVTLVAADELVFFFFSFFFTSESVWGRS